jgi:hypothetical protein
VRRVLFSGLATVLATAATLIPDPVLFRRSGPTFVRSSTCGTVTPANVSSWFCSVQVPTIRPRIRLTDHFGLRQSDQVNLGSDKSGVGHRCLMRLDRGTLLIAVVAVVVAVVLAKVGGDLAGVLVAVAAGLASAALWQFRLYRLDSAARAADLGRGDKAYALPGPIPEGGVAQFLRPEEEVVSFWPRPELDELIEWLVSMQHIAVHLVTGEGGTGKTRLARQLTNKAIELGFRSWWVPDGTERIAVDAAREAGLPVLLVVDYAETRTSLRELLAEVISDAEGPAMRVLLLARSAGEWWQQLINSSGYQLRELLAAVQPINLGPVSDRSRQSEVFNRALVAFADKLGIACPNAEIALADPDAIVLVVHAAALLAVLEHASVGSAARAPGSRTEALAGLLRHEASYWQQTQAARSLGLDVEVTRRIVVAGCLVGADDETSAIKLLMVVADLVDPASRGKAARWLRDLYPVPRLAAGQREWIGSLQPDLIAEQLVVNVCRVWSQDTLDEFGALLD